MGAERRPFSLRMDSPSEARTRGRCVGSPTFVVPLHHGGNDDEDAIPRAVRVVSRASTNCGVLQSRIPGLVQPLMPRKVHDGVKRVTRCRAIVRSWQLFVGARQRSRLSPAMTCRVGLRRFGSVSSTSPDACSSQRDVSNTPTDRAVTGAQPQVLHEVDAILRYAPRHAKASERMNAVILATRSETKGSSSSVLP